MKTVLPQTSQETAQMAALLPSVRRCFVTGKGKPKSELIRFVLGPDSHVVPDISGRLPGRGLWVCADREILAQAISKNLFSKAAKTKAIVDSSLMELVDELLSRRCRELLGLAKAAGATVARESMVLEAVASGQLAYVLLATDAGGDITKKLSRIRTLYQVMDRETLGAALGREHLVSVGLRPHALTTKLQEELVRWQGVSVSLYDRQTMTNGSSERK